MLNSEELKRYNKQILLPGFGLQAQQKLKAASVLLIGVGGLGSPALQYLAAAGVGHIGIMDNDRVEISNLQRQTIYTSNSPGQSKAEEAKKFALALNPLLEIKTWTEKLEAHNADIVKDYDVIIDASDNLETRYLLDEACLRFDKPWIFAAVYRFEGQMAVLNYNDQGIKGPSYNCIFPREQQGKELLNCEVAGVLGVLPGVLGTLQASECIKIISGIGQVLSGKLLQVNLLNMQMHTFEFARKIMN